MHIITDAVSHDWYNLSLLIDLKYVFQYFKPRRKFKLIIASRLIHTYFASLRGKLQGRLRTLLVLMRLYQPTSTKLNGINSLSTNVDKI